MSPNTGPLASASWLVARDLVPQAAKWFVGITFSSPTGATFELEISSEEWGFRFEYQGRVSWIRVTGIPFVHGLDQHELLAQTTKLDHVASILRSIEKRYRLQFEGFPIVHTDLVDADRAITTWLRSL